MENLKPLNVKRTIWIGLGFFTVLMFWQVYNTYMGPILTTMFYDKGFDAGQAARLASIIFAADTGIALLILLAAGVASDKTKTKKGKRMPFIIVSTALTIIALPLMPLVFIWNSLGGMILLIAVVLIAMNVSRLATVALMPDVTPKPLRAKANGIINFVGYVGAILAGGLAMAASIIANLPAEYDPVLSEYVTLSIVSARNYWLLLPFIATAAAMLICVGLMFYNVKENKIVEEMKEDIELGEKLAEIEAAKKIDKKLTKSDYVNISILFAAMFFWWFGFNAAETWWTVYAGASEIPGRLDYVPGLTNMAILVVPIAALIAFLPAIKIINKIGRKHTAMTGLLLIIFGTVPLFFMEKFHLTMILIFVIFGVGWAFINIAAFPMFIEFSNKDNVGRFTSYFYVSTMSAQTLSPLFAAWILPLVGWWALFPYVAIFMAIAFVLMLFFKPAK